MWKTLAFLAALACGGAGALEGRIVFVNPSGQVATVAPDGGALRVLTREAGVAFRFPAWSPGGDWIAAIGVRGEGGGVYLLKDAASAPGRRVFARADRAPIYLYWAPDGAVLSFITTHPQGLALYLAPLDGAARLVTTGQPFYWDWTPDGRRILIHTGTPGARGRLALLDPRAGVEERLGGPGFFRAPAVSSGGRFWAFARVEAGGQRALVVQDRFQDRQVRLPYRSVAAFSWNPKRDLLAYTIPTPTPIGVTRPLRIFQARTQQSQVQARGTVMGFFWSPDGAKLAYLRLAEGTGGRLVDREGTARRAQQAPLELQLWVVALEEGLPRKLATFTPAPSFLTQFLPFFDQYARSHRLWSPDGRALVLSTLDGGRRRLVVVPVDGGPARTIAEGEMAFWSPR